MHACLVSFLYHMIFVSFSPRQNASIIFISGNAYNLILVLVMQANPGFVLAQYVNVKQKLIITSITDHIDHIKNVSGIEHVGLGSDFDGVPR